MHLWEAIVLGVVQGLTEFLPISSTAHLRIASALLEGGDVGAAFSAVIQLGTTAAVIIFFGKDIAQLTKASWAALKQKNPYHSTNSQTAWFVALGTLPICFFGLVLKRFIENEARSMWVVASALLLFGVVLLLAEKRGRQQRALSEMKLKDALLIGFWQALALVPGASRSGTTLTGALFSNFKREEAARYSFLLSIPATGLAGFFELRTLIQQGVGQEWGALCAGVVVSFLSGIAAIWFLMRLVRRHSLNGFAYYRIALGALLLWATSAHLIG
ncbi:MAG: undecaprenyl-diphosphatase UppP [Proteobacteria bacterium]|nr:undecaprenyl-diphosphatase UppP [Cystobacterineae bacterium]MCL2258226.1 undecaprenyl-diphosphatase UppP [Cystobacterineae bacterium]MCL2315430.1 undecaprenyl-diphosphatase UppP [Pseudomonadota bacterium]